MSPYAQHLLEWLMDETSPAVAFERINFALNTGRITTEEALFLLDRPLPKPAGPRVNAPGGAC